MLIALVLISVFALAIAIMSLIFAMLHVNSYYEDQVELLEILEVQNKLDNQFASVLLMIEEIGKQNIEAKKSKTATKEK